MRLNAVQVLYKAIALRQILRKVWSVGLDLGTIAGGKYGGRKIIISLGGRHMVATIASRKSCFGALLTPLFIVIVLSAPAIRAQTFSVLHNFSGGVDGADPFDGLTADGFGNFYGTTSSGGDADQGAVYKLSNHNGSWILTPLHSFVGGNDGAKPYAGVTIGPDGSLYGTTISGGLGCAGGCGTIYKLSPPATVCQRVSCPWTESVVYRFANSQQGLNTPYSGVIFDSAGNLYGTTIGGGAGTCQDPGCGAVYKFTPSGQSGILTVLYSFTGRGDGSTPYAGLTFDPAGNLYGTTYWASLVTGGYGTVFELMPSGAGWSEKTLYTFTGGNDGGNPWAGVTLDGAGNLYGATTEAQNNGLMGAAFELAPSGNSWNYSVLSYLSGSVLGNLTFDGTGNLYGTAGFGGEYGFGFVFELVHSGASWSLLDLHDFTYQNHGPNSPWCSVVFDAAGNLYGTTSDGGTNGFGTIWKLVP